MKTQRNKTLHRYTADFETTTDPNDCRVWLYALCNINNNDEYIIGNTIEDFFELLKDKKENLILYFHNLRFDAAFIFNYLLSHGYKCIKDKTEIADNTFLCLISDTNAYYSIEIYFETHLKNKKVNKCTIYDSLNIISESIEEIAIDFGTELKKGEIDYTKKRDKDYTPTEEEIEYIKNDVLIPARALKTLFDKNLTKMTIGSDALHYYKDMFKHFKHYFPSLPYEVDKELRKAYKGGFTYVSPDIKEKIVGRGLVLDVNSLFSYVLREKELPYGEPLFFEGEYEYDPLYPLYIIQFTCAFDIRINKIPTTQVKGNIYNFNPREYVESSQGEYVTLTLTNVDFELFMEHYKVYDLEYHCGWKFKSYKGFFEEYVDVWFNEKSIGKKEGNKSKQAIAKMMLNSLYGKFASATESMRKYPIFDENGILMFDYYDTEIRNSVYVPVSAFTTSYARKIIIEAAQKIKDYSILKYGKNLYYYSDTDSLHIGLTNIEELKSLIDIDEYKIGSFKIESEFTKAKFLRAKTYIEKWKDGTINTTISGLPKYLADQVTFDNFKIGATYEGKRTPEYVKGGIILKEGSFTLKDR